MHMRSWLCSSPLTGKLVEKANLFLADVIHFDLEDAVPADSKARARAALKAAWPINHPLPVAVRINRLSSAEGLKDLLFLTKHRLTPAIIIIPKAQIFRDVALVAAFCRHSQLFAVIETLDSYFELRQMRDVPQGMKGVIFGAADFAVDMGLDPQQAAPQLVQIKEEISLSARRLGLQAIDSPCFALHQQAVLDSEIEQGRLQGFSGKIAIHPDQVASINQGFSVKEAHKARARQLLAVMESTAGITTEAENMIGPPHLKYARALLSRK